MLQPSHIACLLHVQDKSSSGSSSTLKIEALCFLKLTLATSDTAVYEPYLAALCPPIFAAVAERYYKVCMHLSGETSTLDFQTRHM